MRSAVFGLALLVLAAGCLGAGMSSEEEPRSEEAQPNQAFDEVVRVEQPYVFTGTVEGPQPGGDRVGVSWSPEFRAGLVGLELAFSWGEAVNAFGVQVERPDGSLHEVGPGSGVSTGVDGEVPEVWPGAYSFFVFADDGVVVPDEVRLEATAVYEVVRVSGEAAGPSEETVEDAVQVVETNDGYRAWVDYQAQGDAMDRMSVRGDTVNGEVVLHGASETAEAFVHAWARGVSEDEARERVLTIDVEVRVDGDQVRAVASAPEWDDRGADVRTGVPSSTIATGVLGTTNGAVAFDQARVDGVEASTTNGAIGGSLSGEGSIRLGTTNGAIELVLTPAGSMILDASTTNGGLSFVLAEGDPIGYRLDASVSNGEITEDMREASLSGSDEDATLETTGFEDRTVQVTGNVGSTNGEIRFEGR